MPRTMPDDAPTDGLTVVAESRRPRLIYLAGAQHSGSTILEAILTGSPGIRGVGQFGRFYARQDFESCDCGRPSATCGPCQAVVEAIGDHRAQRRYRRIGQLTRREWGLPLLFLSGRLRAAYAASSDAALRGLCDHEGRTVIVDSSKSVSRALAILDSKLFDVSVVFCVRDSSGFVASRERRTERSGSARTVLRTWKWLSKNVMVDGLLRSRASSFAVLRYEDLATDPVTAVGQLGTELGLDLSVAMETLASAGTFERTFLFEPPRQLDYAKVSFDGSRSSAGSQLPPRQADLVWKSGGILGQRWGYRKGGKLPESRL